MTEDSWVESTRKLFERPIPGICAALIIGVLVSVIVAMRHDVRWLLIVPWASVTTIVWEAVRISGKSRKVSAVLSATSTIPTATICWIIYLALTPIEDAKTTGSSAQGGSALPVQAQREIPSALQDNSEDPDERGKSFSDQPLSHLSNILKSENALAGISRLEPFVGVLFKFTAVVEANNINGGPYGPFTVGFYLEDGSPIICKFPKIFKSFLGRLADKQKVVVTGTLSGSTGASVILEDCHPSQDGR